MLTSKLVDTTEGTILTLGDNVFPSGNTEEYRDCYAPTWGTQKTRTWAALGNHDYDSTTAAAAFAYWGDRAGSSGTGYYSMDIGEWHVVVLNDNVPNGSGSAEVQWLRDDLRSHPSHCTLALWHQPLFLSSQTAGFTRRPAMRPFWNALYAAGADVVVNGHQHDYERMDPMSPDGSPDSAQGIRQFNVGTGGDSQAMPTVIHPHSAYLATGYGVLRLRLRADGYDWDFLPAAGTSIIDAGSGTCH